MKCSSCGKEFGACTHCQHCGVDRVTGLANYSSYDTSDYHGANTSHYNSSYNSSPKTMVCYACGEIIPINSEYCPYCRKKLYETCPNCGHEYSSQYLNCNQCGTNLKQYLKEEKEKERKRTERANETQREEINKSEAQQLRSNFSSTILYIIFFIILAGGLFILFFSYLEYFNFFLLVIFILILGWGCPWLASVINESITNSKIEKWKQEHPNDPRCKYL